MIRLEKDDLEDVTQLDKLAATVSMTPNNSVPDSLSRGCEVELIRAGC